MANKKELEALIVLAGKVDPSLQKAMQKASSLADETGASTNKLSNMASRAMGIVKNAAVMVGTGILAVGASIVKTTNDTVEYADKIDKMAIRTGLSFEQLQKLDYMTGQLGVNFDTVGSSIAKMTKNMASADEDGSAAALAFKALNIHVLDLNKNLRPQGEIFNETIVALSQMQNEAERNALAMKIFGNGAAELIPLFDAGVDGLQELSRQSEEYGMIMSDEMIVKSNKLGDTWDTMKKSLKGVGFSLVETLLPYLQNFVDLIQNNMPNIKEGVQTFAEKFGKLVPIISSIYNGGAKLFNFISRNGSKIAPIIVGIVAAMVAWKAITLGMAIYETIMAAIAIANGTATVTQWALNAAVLANPMTWIILAIVAAIGILVAGIWWLWNNWDQVTAFVVGLWKNNVIPFFEGVGNWFSGLGQKIVNGFKSGWEGLTNFFTNLWDGIVGGIKDRVNGIVGLVNIVIRAINGLSFTVPDWVPELGGKTFGFNIPEMPMFAQGGFANQPSIFGEAGPEAAIPLKRTPRSLSLLNQTAKALGVSGGGGVQIVYSPNITGANTTEIENMLRNSYKEFMEMIDRYFAEKERERFA